MRQMRKMPETTASFYQNITLAVLATIYMLCDGSSFGFVFEFSALTWFVVTMSSLLVILA